MEKWLHSVKPNVMKDQHQRRRKFLRLAGFAAAGLGVGIPAMTRCTSKSRASDAPIAVSVTEEKFFTISLAEWSFHRALYSGKLKNLDFPAKAKNEYGIQAVEFVNAFFKDKVSDKSYLGELKHRCDDLGIASILIMIDDEGELGSKDNPARLQAVENHKRWMEAAATLGCKWIRVNATTPVDKAGGTKEEIAKAIVSSLRQLATFGVDFGVGVIVENHGGLSSDCKWLTSVLEEVGMNECGALPDFGNFCLRRESAAWDSPCLEWYDRYQGVAELMPYAKDVSAKSIEFDENGNCVETDYPRMLEIVRKSGYRGFVGIEFEGQTISEEEGVRNTLNLLLAGGGRL